MPLYARAEVCVLGTVFRETLFCSCFYFFFPWIEKFDNLVCQIGVLQSSDVIRRISFKKFNISIVLTVIINKQAEPQTAQI